MKCMNCGSAFDTDYCGQCGQEASAARVTPAELKRGFLRAASLERGWLHTIVDLSVRPGTMVRNYLDGKRVVYIGPFKYALTMVGLYILTVAVIGVPVPRDATAAGDLIGGLEREFNRFGAEFLQRTGQFLILSLCPIRAGVTWLLFRKRGLTYSEHLTMILFVTGHCVIAYILWAVTNRLVPSGYGYLTAVETSICVAYQAWVLRGVCAGSKWSALGGSLLAEAAAWLGSLAITLPAMLVYWLVTRILAAG